MNVHPKNICTDETHDWAPSLVEAGVECCMWPGCRASRPASIAPVAGVDIPEGATVVDARRAA